MTYPQQVSAWMNRDKKAKDWDRMRVYNIELETYLLQCISLFTQIGVKPPEMKPELERVLNEKFLSAVKGE